ncbi:MAG TPA: TolC family protein [Candidatus Binatia bacterium]|nr:TolC family protein [Candidatus Binatia bacterium]
MKRDGGDIAITGCRGYFRRWVVPGMRRGGLFLTAAVLAARTGRAESIDLSLADAVARALSEGTAARIATERVEGARALADISRAALLPTLQTSLAGSDQIFNLKTFGITPPGASSLVGPFTVLDGRVSAATKLIDVAAIRRYQAARQSMKVSESERRATENNVAAAVATVYVAMQRAQAKVEQAEANVQLFEKLRDLAKDQEQAGVAIKLDTMRADVQLTRERQALLVARNDRDASRLALLHAIGSDLGAEVRLTDALVERTNGFASVEDALSLARVERPELRASEERLQAATLRLAAVRAERLPTIGAEAFAAENGNGPSDLDTTYTAGGTLTLPIFTGGRIDGEISAARAEARSLELEKLELERQINEDVRRAMLALQSAKSRIGLAQENADLASAQLDVTRDRFANGLSTSIEVDNAQTSLTAAKNAHIDALADEAQADIDLRKATGRIRELVPGG